MYELIYKIGDPKSDIKQEAINVIKMATEDNIEPTGVKVIDEDVYSIGIAWGNDKVFIDLEISDDNKAMFSFRERGEDPEFIYINWPMSECDLFVILDKIKDMLK